MVNLICAYYSNKQITIQAINWRNTGNILEKLSAVKRTVIGIGISAYNRVVAGFFLPNFVNICAADSLELLMIESKMNCICLEKNYNGVEGSTSTDLILENTIVQNLLKKEKGYIMPYRNSPKIDRLADELGVKVLANSGSLVDKLEQKAFFTKLLAKCKIEPVPGEIVEIDKIDSKIVERWQKKYKKPVVLQLADLPKGGGVGMFLLDKKKDYDFFQKKLAFFRRKGYFLKKARIARYIKGEAPSITCCLTRHGLLLSALRARPIGIKSLVGENKSGAFCGHDWFYKMPEWAKAEAEKMATKIGRELKLLGYKGVFGLDFLIDNKAKKIYPTECNPRHLGPEPVSSLAQMEMGIVPLEVYDILEHMDIPYFFDFAKTTKDELRPLNCSQLLLFNRTGKTIKVEKEVAAGVYKLSGGKFSFLRPGFANWDIKESFEFIITDRVPKKGKLIKPGGKILRLVFKRPVIESRYKLLPEIEELVEGIYQSI